MFNCKLLDVSNDDFLIEDIFPRTGIGAVCNASNFSVSARSNGTFIYIEECCIDKWDQERGIPFFHIKLPARILYQQRRKTARFRIPLRVSAAGASITLFEENDLVGRIIDISAGGCRAEFQMPSAVKVDESFQDCAITIPKLLEIHSEVIVRHFHEDKTSQTLVCGFELTEMHVTDRRRLEHFIQNIARSTETS